MTVGHRARDCEASEPRTDRETERSDTPLYGQAVKVRSESRARCLIATVRDFGVVKRSPRLGRARQGGRREDGCGCGDRSMKDVTKVMVLQTSIRQRNRGCSCVFLSCPALEISDSRRVVPLVEHAIGAVRQFRTTLLVGNLDVVDDILQIRHSR